MFERNQFIAEKGIIRLENFCYIPIIALENIVPGNVGQYHKMTERKEELVFMMTFLSQKFRTGRAFFTRSGQPPHIIPGLFERMDFLSFTIIGVDGYF